MAHLEGDWANDVFSFDGEANPGSGALHSPRYILDDVVSPFDDPAGPAGSLFDQPLKPSWEDESPAKVCPVLFDSCHCVHNPWM